MKLSNRIYVCMSLLAATTSKADTSILFFDRPADYFEETFVIGNGTQGGIIYGNPSKERISLNDITFWTGEPDTVVYSPGAYKYIPDIRTALDNGNYDLAEELQQKVQGHYSANYQPIGNVLIDFADKSEARDYVRCLNLADATAKVNYTKGCNEITTEYIASAAESVIAIKISDTQTIEFQIYFE